MMQPEDGIKGCYGRVGHVTRVTIATSRVTVNGVVDILNATEARKLVRRVPLVIGHSPEAIIGLEEVEDTFSHVPFNRDPSFDIRGKGCQPGSQIFNDQSFPLFWA